MQPLLDALGRSPQQKNSLLGQDVVMQRNDVKAIIALEVNKNIHLLIYPVLGNIERFSKIELKGLSITEKDWSVEGHPTQRYLDISCSTGESPSFQRPFIKFAEDVLFEISADKIVPSDAVYKTCLRWRKFWSKDSSGEVTSKWLHGLFGELLFLIDIIERHGSNTVLSWTGPLGRDHDFQAGTDLALEVKTSTEIPFKIHCNIRQLDHFLFKRLYLICYKLTVSENGQRLPELVRSIEAKLSGNDQLRDKFYERLVAAGYQMQLESKYEEFVLDVSGASVLKVDDKFPKIVENSFANPPDHRISDIRYTLQLTGLPELSIDNISDELKLLNNEE